MRISALGVYVLGAVLATSACSARTRPTVSPDSGFAARLAEADALLRAGCLDCLEAAYRAYDELRLNRQVTEAATLGFLRTAGLIAVRERELGMAESGSLARAREVTADNETASALFNPLFDVAETLPVGGAARQMADEADFNRRAVAYRNLQAYTNLLRTAADNDPLNAYLWIAFNCAYSPPGEQRLGERLEAVPTWRATALLSFKAATCIGYGGAAVDRLLEADPRFVEINYFLAARDMVRGRADEAIERWRTAFSWRPRWPSVTNALAQALLSLEEFGECESVDHIATQPD